MILAIDGYEANEENRVGIGRYAFEILQGIARLEEEHGVFDQVRVYVPGPVRPHMPKATKKFVYRSVPVRPLWTFVGLPFSLFVDRPQADVVFSPTHYVPRFVGTPKVMAIMDVSYLEYPELFRPEDLHKLTQWTSYAVRHTKKIITISEFSKHAIIEAYHVPSERVVVAYPALPEAIIRPSMADTTDLKLPKRYILTVGTLQPRKNFTKLIEALKHIKDESIHLVLVGKKGWLYEDILAAPAKYGVEHRVHFLDFVPDKALPGIYSQASCFVLPSLYEGFGLPVLEAMSYGVPVVVSNGSSLPEIAGKAGIYVDPNDTASIAHGIDMALSEPAKDKAARIALGKARAKDFTWDHAAEQVMTVLSDVAKKGAV